MIRYLAYSGFVLVENSQGSRNVNNSGFLLENYDFASLDPKATFNAESIESYFLQRARSDASFSQRSRIFAIDFSQLTKEPAPADVEAYLKKLRLMILPSDTAIILPYQRQQSSRSSENSNPTRMDTLSSLNTVIENIVEIFPENFYTLVFLEVGAGTSSSAQNSNSVPGQKEAVTAIVLNGGSKESSTGFSKWLMEQKDFLLTPFVTGIPSIAWKDRLRRQKDSSERKCLASVRELKTSQRHIDFWTKILNNVFLLRRFSQVVNFEEYVKKQQNRETMPVVVDLIGSCLELFFAAVEMEMPYVGELPRADYVADKVETVFERQVN